MGFLPLSKHLKRVRLLPYLLKSDVMWIVSKWYQFIRTAHTFPTFTHRYRKVMEIGVIFETRCSEYFNNKDHFTMMIHDTNELD